MLSLPLLIASTIFFTDPSANLGVSSYLWPDGITTTALPGTLQVTQQHGLGVCSSVGWSCTEVEYPESLRVSWQNPVDVTRVQFGLAAPDDLAVLVTGAYFPGFAAGNASSTAIWTGLFAGITALDIFGLGASAGGSILNPNAYAGAVSLYAIDYTRSVGPTPPGPDGPGPTNPRPLDEPTTAAMLGFGAGAWALLRAIAGWRRASAVIEQARRV